MRILDPPLERKKSEKSFKIRKSFQNEESFKNIYFDSDESFQSSEDNRFQNKVNLFQGDNTKIACDNSINSSASLSKEDVRAMYSNDIEYSHKELKMNLVLIACIFLIILLDAVFNLVVVKDFYRISQILRSDQRITSFNQDINQITSYTLLQLMLQEEE